MPHIVQVQDLRKRYGEVEAVRGISFNVEQGEVFGMLGPNGAGKTTTVEILEGLRRADGGSATVAGVDVLADPSGVKRRIGVQLQSSAFPEHLTAKETVDFFAACYDLTVDAVALLRLVDLDDRARQLQEKLSGGQRQRLSIATALVNSPQVLFLDEPTTGLDPEARVALWAEVERLAEQESLTILLTTHYLEEADRLAERVAIMSRGRIVVEGRPEVLKADLRGELVTVEFGDTNGGIEDAAEIVRAFDGATDVGVDGRLVRARVPNGAQAIPTILSTLDGRGFTVESVTTARPSLDDVYLHYTGRDFATEDAAGNS